MSLLMSVTYSMKYLHLTVFFVLCALAHSTFSSSTAKSDDGQYEIIAGDCGSALAKEMIYREHVHKTRLPLIGREATSSWSGNARIYCLKVLNDKDESKGATCSIKDGGIGFDHVTIEMHSPANHGLEFDIEVYAR